jgi:hypothetical protein
LRVLSGGLNESDEYGGVEHAGGAASADAAVTNFNGRVVLSCGRPEEPLTSLALALRCENELQSRTRFQSSTGFFVFEYEVCRCLLILFISQDTRSFNATEFERRRDELEQLNSAIFALVGFMLLVVLAGSLATYCAATRDVANVAHRLRERWLDLARHRPEKRIDVPVTGDEPGGVEHASESPTGIA